ncbi:MAG: hypothetical protein AAGG46_01100, partial [Planctomycetota bacterium]
MPKPSAAAVVEATGDGAADPTHRLLALIAEGKQQAWFFKLVGPLEQAGVQAEAVLGFYRSVTFGDRGPEWTLPDAWTEAPAAGMRRATLTVEPGLDISVIGLPLTGNWDAQLLDNLNRWRGQMALPPAAAAHETAGVTNLSDSARGVLIDLTGKFSSGGMSAPFASAPFAGGAAGAVPKPASPPAPPAAIGTIAFEAPGAWIDLGATSMRKANLKTSDAADAAEVRAMSFAAFGQMGDPLANVNRWRNIVGLGAATAAEVDELGQPVTIAGEPAVLFEIIPDEAERSAATKSITAAMQTRDDKVWFYMLTGPPETVAAERPRFDEWLASVRFDSTGSP